MIPHKGGATGIGLVPILLFFNNVPIAFSYTIQYDASVLHLLHDMLFNTHQHDSRSVVQYRGNSPVEKMHKRQGFRRDSDSGQWLNALPR